MTSSEHMHVQELAAVVISRLLSTARTLHNSGVSTMVAEMGGVPPLVRLLRDGSPAGQQQAACATAEVC